MAFGRHMIQSTGAYDDDRDRRDVRGRVGGVQRRGRVRAGELRRLLRPRADVGGDAGQEIGALLAHAQNRPRNLLLGGVEPLLPRACDVLAYIPRHRMPRVLGALRNHSNCPNKLGMHNLAHWRIRLTTSRTWFWSPPSPGWARRIGTVKPAGPSLA